MSNIKNGKAMEGKEFMAMSCDRVLETLQERGGPDGHSFPNKGEKWKISGK